MERADIGKGMPHLFAGLIACGLVAAVLSGAEIMAVRLEHATIRFDCSRVVPA